MEAVDIREGGDRRGAETYQFNVAPHNYYNHLAGFVSVSLYTVLPNVHIMEIDVDDLPWKYDLVTTTSEFVDGHMAVPTAPGWDADLNEEVPQAHPWSSAMRR